MDGLIKELFCDIKEINKTQDGTDLCDSVECNQGERLPTLTHST